MGSVFLVLVLVGGWGERLVCWVVFGLVVGWVVEVV